MVKYSNLGSLSAYAVSPCCIHRDCLCELLPQNQHLKSCIASNLCYYGRYDAFNALVNKTTIFRSKNDDEIDVGEEAQVTCAPQPKRQRR